MFITYWLTTERNVRVMFIECTSYTLAHYYYNVAATKLETAAAAAAARCDDDGRALDS